MTASNFIHSSLWSLCLKGTTQRYQSHAWLNSRQYWIARNPKPRLSKRLKRKTSNLLQRFSTRLSTWSLRFLRRRFRSCWVLTWVKLGLQSKKVLNSRKSFPSQQSCSMLIWKDWWRCASMKSIQVAPVRSWSEAKTKCIMQNFLKPAKRSKTSSRWLMKLELSMLPLMMQVLLSLNHTINTTMAKYQALKNSSRVIFWWQTKFWKRLAASSHQWGKTTTFSGSQSLKSFQRILSKDFLNLLVHLD